MAGPDPRPRVSIVTPVYNAAPFLVETITSVLTQQDERWELLLVDDGSTDASLEIAEAYARLVQGKIRVFTHPGRVNLGKSSTRNLGILHARGEYLVFLDADDRLLEEKLARQVALLDSHPEVGMVYGRTVYWYAGRTGSNRKRRDSLSKLGVKPHTFYTPPELLTRWLRDSGTVPCLCALTARRSHVLAVGCFDESIQHLYEDQVLLAKLCLAAPVWVDDAAGELYRQHPGSSSSIAQQTGEYHPWLPDPARLRFLDWLQSYLAQVGMTNPQLAAALRRAYAPYRSRFLRHIWLPLRSWGAELLNSGGLPI